MITRYFYEVMDPAHRARQSDKANRCLPCFKCLSTNFYSCTTIAFTCVFMIEMRLNNFLYACGYAAMQVCQNKP